MIINPDFFTVADMLSLVLTIVVVMLNLIIIIMRFKYKIWSSNIRLSVKLLYVELFIEKQLHNPSSKRRRIDIDFILKLLLNQEETRGDVREQYYIEKKREFLKLEESQILYFKLPQLNLTPF